MHALVGLTAVFRINFENDVFYQEDGGYTNGFALNYAHGFDSPFSKDNTPAFLLPLIEGLGMNKYADGKHGISYQLAQIMSTPEDIQTPELIEDQQPYAGLLAGRMNVYTMDENGSRRIGVIIGVVGPSSAAEHAQKVIHAMTGSDEPQGWDHQLKTEAIFRLESSRAKKLWRAHLGGNLESDLSSFAEGGVGNLSSNISVGMRWRFGGYLSDSFPLAMDFPGREINPTAGMSGARWQIFLNAEARYEFNNILIEGNTFRESHGVTLKHEQALLGYGFSFNFSKWAITYTGAFSTKAYDTQPGIGKFGSVSVTYRLK